MPKEIKNKYFRRKVISLKTKIDILEQLKKGQRVFEVARFYSMNEATIRTIRSNEEAIKKSVAAGNSTSMNTISYIRNSVMENMEKALNAWIEDNMQNGIPIDINLIKIQALKLYDMLKDEMPNTSVKKQPSFVASNGWFERFKNRYCLHNLNLKDEESGAEAQKFLQFAKTGGEECDDFAEWDIKEFMADTKLAFEDLIGIVPETEADSRGNEEPQPDPIVFNVKNIQDGLTLGRKLVNHFIEIDPNIKRAALFQQDITKCLSRYEKVYKEMTKKQSQTFMTDFFK